MAKRPEDRYANTAMIEATESGISTLTFVPLLTGVSLGSGTGMLIDEISYMVGQGTIEDIVAAGDVLNCALVTSNAIPNLSGADRRIIHNFRMSNNGLAIGGGLPVVQPYVYKFDPPMIFAGPRLFGGIVGASLAAAASVDLKFLFRYIDLTDREYLEIAETFVLVG